MAIAHSVPRDADTRTDGVVTLTWMRDWSSDADKLLEALPADLLSDRETLHAMWQHGRGRRAQRIGLFYLPDGTPVGILPVRRDGLRWLPLAEDMLPASRFAVLPGYTDQALRLLRQYIYSDCFSFYETPTERTWLTPQQSAVVDLCEPWPALLRRKHYAKRDRQCRAKTSMMVVEEDEFDRLPQALDIWADTWRARGFHESARQRDERLLVLQILARQGRLKTFSLWDGDVLAAYIANVLDRDVLHSQVIATRPEYRERYAGIRVYLASLDWAYANGLREYDMGPTNLSAKLLWGEPLERTYLLAVGPFGSRRFGRLVQDLNALRWRALYKLGLRS